MTRKELLIIGAAVATFAVVIVATDHELTKREDSPTAKDSHRDGNRAHSKAALPTASATPLTAHETEMLAELSALLLQKPWDPYDLEFRKRLNALREEARGTAVEKELATAAHIVQRLEERYKRLEQGLANPLRASKVWVDFYENEAAARLKYNTTPVVLKGLVDRVHQVRGDLVDLEWEYHWVVDLMVSPDRPETVRVFLSDPGSASRYSVHSEHKFACYRLILDSVGRLECYADFGEDPFQDRLEALLRVFERPD